MGKNRIELTGTIERVQKITTRRGSIMAKWLLRVGDHRFGCVAFGNIAETVLGRGDGVEIGVTGTAAINSWKTDDGVWRNDFQATAWAVEINGETIAYEKGGQSRKKEPGRQPHQGQQAGVQDYHGGPF
jgi:single-stranded DNA-binding protein